MSKIEIAIPIFVYLSVKTARLQENVNFKNLDLFYQFYLLNTLKSPLTGLPPKESLAPMSVDYFQSLKGSILCSNYLHNSSVKSINNLTVLAQ